MSKRPSFNLHSQTNNGESGEKPIGSPFKNKTKNHEIEAREWLCQVLASNRLTGAELALLGFLFGRSCGLRFSSAKLRRDLANELNMQPENISRLIKSLASKNLILVYKKHASKGLKNVFYVSMTYPEDFGRTSYSFSRSNFPLLWGEVEKVFSDAVIGGKIDTYRGVISQNNASIGIEADTQRVSGLIPNRIQNDINPPHFDPTNTDFFAAPSILSNVFIDKYSFVIEKRIKSARDRSAILEGLQVLVRLHGHDVIEERLGLLYADKGESVVKPNFHKYLELNLEWYGTQLTFEKRQGRIKYLENLARELFQGVHEGFYEALNSKGETRPNFSVSIEATARTIGFNFQKHYDSFCRAAGDARVMGGIANEFSNRILSHYQKHTLPSHNKTEDEHGA